MAWSGLSQTAAFINSSSFEMEDGTMINKLDIIQNSAQYMGSGANGQPLKGVALCD